MKFPITHQHDSMQCGIACMQMICKYFGRDYSIDSLSKICSATTQGVSMLGLNGGLANYWAELDLNQRRHIANEFTVRPH